MTTIPTEEMRCRAKKRYTRKKLALNALSQVRAHSNRATVPCSVYKCPHCKNYHLTSKPPRPKKG